MKLGKYLCWLVSLAGMYPGATLAIDTPDFVLERGHWEQLVIPANSAQLSVRELFSDDLLADDYNTSWVIYRYDAQAGQYVNPGIDGTIETGTGFWIIQIADAAVVLDLPESIPGPDTQSSDACAVDMCFEAPLSVQADQSSYTMLGTALATRTPVSHVRFRAGSNNPSCQNGCTVEEAAALLYLSGQLWHYDSTTNNYVDLNISGQIDPWQALWVQTSPALTGSAQLLFPYSSASPEVSTELAEASRFLAQTTFGPTTAAIDDLLRTSYSRWIDAQIDLPMSSMLDAFDTLQLANPTSAPSRDWVFESFWTQAVKAEDQLRQRMAFALSQIFVISLREGAVASFPRGVADFYTQLASGAFGNFRNLLEQVTLHPMMGAYLSHLGNEKGNPETGKVPDENFAREIMQLFSIGLHQLNTDGTVALDGNGNPLETYSNSDVQGLARVFTGFSWNGPDTSIGRFQGWISDPDRQVQSMQAYPQFHSTREKRFLGTITRAQAASNPLVDLDIALDALFNHPNVGPFIGTQLIQRLVTSNPSRSYVSRVTAAFNDNGEGVRGDLRAVVRAILLDPEARDSNLVNQANTGRIREPILRLTHWMRSFDAQPENGRYIL